MMIPSWFPPEFQKCTLPILRSLDSPGAYDLCGSAFLIKYDGMNYVVTAKHVLDDVHNPRIGYNVYGEPVHAISIEALETIGLRWIPHPNNLDLAIMPMPIEPFMDVSVIDEPFWQSPATINNDADILHLGYPDHFGASYRNGATAYFALAMSGKILKSENGVILTKTPGHEGASGGPLFLKRQSGFPQVIGIAVIAKKGRQTEDYLNKTEFLPISHVVEILTSDEMKKQIVEYRSQR